MSAIPTPAPTLDVNPSAASIAALGERPDDDAIIMVNLLRFRPNGREAYARYGAAAGPCVQARGGGPAFMASVTDGDAWDTVLLVRYPRRAAYLDMQSDPIYVGAIPDRTAGLAARLLYPFHDPNGDPDDPFDIAPLADDEVMVTTLRAERSTAPPSEGQVELRLFGDMPMVSDAVWTELEVVRYPSAADVAPRTPADGIRLVCNR